MIGVVRHDDQTRAAVGLHGALDERLAAEDVQLLRRDLAQSCSRPAGQHQDRRGCQQVSHVAIPRT